MRREKTRDRRPNATPAHGLSTPPKAARQKASGPASAPRKLAKAAISTKRLPLEQPSAKLQQPAKGGGKGGGKGGDKGGGASKAKGGKKLVDPISHYAPLYQTPTRPAATGGTKWEPLAA